MIYVLYLFHTISYCVSVYHKTWRFQRKNGHIQKVLPHDEYLDSFYFREKEASMMFNQDGVLVGMCFGVCGGLCCDISIHRGVINGISVLL